MKEGKKIIYIAGPLFNDMEKQRNLELDEELRKNSFESYLPQRDGGEFAIEVKKENSPQVVRKRIFNKDVQAIFNCDILIFLYDGRVPDEGACVELGIAYALEIVCIWLKTVSRTFIEGNDNLMITESLEASFHSIEEVLTYIKGKSNRKEK